MYISTPPKPEDENFQMKIYYPAGDRTPDTLNQKQTHNFIRANVASGASIVKCTNYCDSNELQFLPGEGTEVNIELYSII